MTNLIRRAASPAPMLVCGGLLAAVTRFLALFLSSLCFVGFPTANYAQNIPSYADPTAREEMPDLTLVPAIRFLTTSDFPPFNYVDENGELLGYNIDLARAICGVIGARCTIQPWPWAQVTEALSDLQGDVLVGGLAINAENAERFDFTNIYLQLPGRFVTAASSAIEFSHQAIDNASLGIVTGSAHEVFAGRFFPMAETERFDTIALALEAVRSGQVDYFFGDGMRASFWLHEKGECCRFVGGTYIDPSFFGEGMSIAVSPGLDGTRQALNWALGKLQKNGTMEEIYLRWFPVSFF